MNIGKTQVILNSKNKKHRLAIEIFKTHWVWYFLEKHHMKSPTYTQKKVFSSKIENNEVGIES